MPMVWKVQETTNDSLQKIQTELKSWKGKEKSAAKEKTEEVQGRERRGEIQKFLSTFINNLERKMKSAEWTSKSYRINDVCDDAHV